MKHSNHTIMIDRVRVWVRRIAAGALAVLVLLTSAGASAPTKVSAIDCKGLSQTDCDALNGNWTSWIPDSCPTTGSAENTISTSDPDRFSKYPHIKTAFQFFYSKGYSPAQAAGIVGNLMVESGDDIDPRATGDVDKKTGLPTSFGIAQWHNERGTAMFAWVGSWAAKMLKDPEMVKTYPDVKDGKYSFTGQLEYLKYDLEVNHKSIQKGFTVMATPETAAIYWDKEFEVSDGKARAKRVANALEVYKTAQTNKWTDGIVVASPASSMSDPTPADVTDCSSAVAGSIEGTTCADIGKQTQSNYKEHPNPYVCDNPEVICAGGKDAGVGLGYLNGEPHKIRLCKIIDGLVVNAFVSKNTYDMVACANGSAANCVPYKGAAVGHAHLTAHTCDGFRPMSCQISVRRKNCGTSHYDIYDKPSGDCDPPAARPGYSNHQMGLAVDWADANSTGKTNYIWLKANAKYFGFENLRSSGSPEPWHWSVDGR